jgi:DNA-binding transcriptional LysR family regulator
MLDRYLLRYFLAVVEAGNFSKAAARVNVTQPSLSVGIAKLEEQLGRRLFHRTSRRIHLTDAGSRFLVHARNIMREYNMALEDAAHSKHLPLLRIGVLLTIPATVLEAIVIRQRIVGAPAHIEFLEGSERDLSSKLDQGRVEAALTLLRDGNEAEGEERICREGYSLALARSHPLSAAKEIAAEDLANDMMIIRRHCEVLAETSRHFTDRNVRPAFGLRTNNDEKALALVRAGHGVTVMPDSYRDPEVRRVKLKGFMVRRTIGVRIGRPKPELESSLHDFLTAARAAFGQL